MREAAALHPGDRATHHRGRVTQRFSAQDRKLLLSTTGVGAGMVQRLEDAGFHSLQQLQALGAQHVVMAMCEFVGDDAWANRRRAIQRVIEQVEAGAERQDAWVV